MKKPNTCDRFHLIKRESMNINAGQPINMYGDSKSEFSADPVCCAEKRWQHCEWPTNSGNQYPVTVRQMNCIVKVNQGRLQHSHHIQTGNSPSRG